MSRVEKWLFRKVLGSLGNPSVRFHLWDGDRISTSDAAPVADVFIKDRTTLLKFIYNPELYFGDAYSDGSLEVKGDLIALLDAVYRSVAKVSDMGGGRSLASLWLGRKQANTRGGSRRNIHHHYDIGTDFYKLWLDSRLVYTCGYFPSARETLEEGQVAKMDYVCQKIQLQPGETVVEAGCGWGALALHMARHYGVSVKAYNISREQIRYARERAQREGLNDRVEFIEDDYRNISGVFDAFVSVGMLEHVGPNHYQELGSVINRTVKQDGRGFLHFIGRDRERLLNVWIRKRIFPGAYPPTLRQVMDVLEPGGFSVIDVENLRMHYARTLECWLDRFESSVDRVSEMFGPQFVRAWRLYLAGSLVAFQTGWMQLFQVAFARPARTQIPWNRKYLYASDWNEDEEKRWITATR